MNINTILLIIGAVALVVAVLAVTDRNVYDMRRNIDRTFDRTYRIRTSTRRYALVTWPDCQYFMEREGFQDRCHLVDPGENTYLDSSYMVPTDMFTEGETTGELYVMVAYHDSQLYENDNSLLRDYNGNVFIPVK